jgi:hypothetical protein
LVTPEDIARIKEEEMVRIEIRNQLVKSTEKNTGLWHFLNSTFGLWLLSAVFISGAGALFTLYQQRTAVQQRERDTIERLDFELGYRLSQTLVRLYDLTDRQNPRANIKPGIAEREVKEVLAILHEPTAKTIAPLYAEFGDMGIPSMIAELMRHTNDAEERKKLAVTLSDVIGGKIERGNLLDINAKAGHIVGTMLLPRWRTNYFYFTDCSREAPFC